MASVERRQTRLAHKANQDTGKGTRQVTPRQAVGGAYRGITAPVRLGGRAGRQYSGRGMLTAELLAGVGIVAIRAVEDYEPQADGTLKGTIGHPAGQYGPLPILAGLLTWFFLLSFLAARGGTRAKVAVIFGGLTDLVLAMKSMPHMEKVAATFSGFGTAKLPAGDWQTSGTQAGSPLTGGSTSPAGAAGSGAPAAGSPSVPDDIVNAATKPLAQTAGTQPGLPFIEHQLGVIAGLGQSGWHWIDKHLFGGKPFWNGL